VRFRLSDHSTVKSGRCPTTLKMEAASRSETVVVVTYKTVECCIAMREQSATSGSLWASTAFRQERILEEPNHARTMLTRIPTECPV
jgi:hypothetical protein